MNQRFLSFFLFFFLVATGQAAVAKDHRYADWKQFSDRLAQDKSLLRYYTFEEPGDEVPNLAVTKRGSFIISVPEPYYNATLLPRENTDYPRWTEGRFPGKPALSFRSAQKSARRSMFYGTTTNVLTLETWIRTHANSDDNTGAILFSVGSGFGGGWFLKTTSRATSLRIGRPGEQGGDVGLSIKPLTGHVWHHVVAVVDRESLRLYVDGEMAGAKEFQGGFQQPQAPGKFVQRPEEDRGGLKIGSIRRPDNTLWFDCDELALYDRTLTAQEIRAHFEAGQPSQSAAEQELAHRALLEKDAMRDEVKIRIPRESYGYFPAGKPVPLTVVVPTTVKLAGPLTVAATLYPLDGDAFFTGKKSLPLSGTEDACLLWPLPFPKTCGLYRMDIEVKDSTGSVVATKSYPVAASVPVVPMSERPASSPLAGHEIIRLHNEDLALGGRAERIIPYISKLPNGEPNLQRLDARVDQILGLGLDLMVCVEGYYDPGKQASRDPKKFEAWLRPIVERYKGRVKYWEILNEPNAHHVTPPQYVALLKVAHRVIREIDPDARIVGICGVTNYPEWTEDVLAAGGGGFFDILSFHNYIGSSPISAWRSNHKIERIRASLVAHLGKEIPIWNSEGGIEQPRRVKGRILTDVELLEHYPRGRRENGITLVPANAITMATEHVGACWQTQSILLDCALGVSRWFMLMGPSNFHPRGSGSSGFPSEKGIAYAALASVLGPMKSVRLIPISSSSAAGVMVTSLDDKMTAALFSDVPTTRTFSVQRNGVYHGMDFLGNPMTWEATNHLLTVSFDMEPVYVFDVSGNLGEAPFLAVKGFPALVSPGSSVDGVVRVANLFSGPLVGELKVTSPLSTLSYNKKIVLDPGKNLDVPFRMKAGPLSRGDHLLFISLSQKGKEIASTEVPFTSEGVARGIPKITSPMPLDGDSSKWQGIPEEIADTASQVVIGRPPVGYYEPNAWQGPKDLSFSVKTAWRPDDGIYFFITVADDKIQTVPPDQLGKAFLQDALEFFFDGRPLQDQTPVYSFGAEQILVVPAGSEKAQPCNTTAFARYGDSVEIKAVGKRIPTGYVIEGRIRPRENAPFKLVPGTRLGMDFVIDDAAEAAMTRKTQMALHGTAVNSRNTSDFGRYYLMDGAVAPVLNLLRNADLIQGEGDRVFEWKFSKGIKDANAAAASEIQGGVKEMDGKRVLWISIADEIQAHSMWTQTFPAAAETAYTVSYRLKANLNGTSKWCNGSGGVYFLGSQDKWLGWKPAGGFPATSSADWGTFNETFLTPPGTQKLGFRFQVLSSGVQGTADFFCADMVVSELSNEPFGGPGPEDLQRDHSESK